MFCTKCGKELREGAAFCTSCGTPVSKPVNPGPPPVEPPPITQRPPVQPPAANTRPTEKPIPPVTPPPPAAYTPSEPSKKKKGKGGLIALIIILVLVIGAGGFVVLCQTGVLPFELPFELPFLSSDKGDTDDSDDEEDEGDADQSTEYEDTVDIAEFVAAPGDFDGKKIGVNAEVSKAADTIVRAVISSGEDELEAEISFSEDDIDTFSRGDAIYIEGTFHAGETNTFDPAVVTLTDGREAGTSVHAAASTQSSPGDEEGGSAEAETPARIVEDYTPFQGYFTSAASEDSFAANGGPLVILTSERSSLSYDIRYYAGDGSQAAITGQAPMDGSTEIPFYGSDGCGNTVSGTLTLLENGSVAVESTVVDTGNSALGLKIPYTEMAPCTFADYFTRPQAPYNAQEVVVTASGSSATVALYNWVDGDWVEALSFQANIGSNGITATKTEGDKCTPAGTYDILFAFGTQNITSGIPYQTIQDGDVWVTDPNSAYYNTIQSSSLTGADWKGAENLYTKFTKGRSVACIYFGFNGDGLTPWSATYNGGSDLFLDGIGSNGSLTTGYGDIKTSGQNVLDLLAALDIDKNPIITIQ